MVRKSIYSILLLVIVSLNGFSTPEIEVYPLTNQVLVFHYTEGEVIYAKRGEAFDADQVFKTPLDLNIASLETSYAINSPDDPNYSSTINPLSINRKSKPTAFANFCQTTQYIPYFNVNGCVNLEDDHIMEHWIYLSLSNPLQEGAEYNINLNGSISNETFTFTFEALNQFSEIIHVNNIGYSTQATEKYAYLYHWMGDGGSFDLSAFDSNTFSIRTLDNEEVFNGTINFRNNELAQETYQWNPNETPNQNFLGAEVYECDFSNFNTPGQYKLCVSGIGCSYPFEISCGVLRQAYHAVMRGLYQNRSGIDIDSSFSAGERPAPHNPNLTPGFAGKLVYSSTTYCEVNDDNSNADLQLWEQNELGALMDAYGWYQDAGDWDAYIDHFKVPINLLFTYEYFDENFNDGELLIPESGNGIPDILDEARWLIRFYKRLKDETENNNWTSGGVPGGRIFPDLWGNDLGPNNILRGSWEDTDRKWMVSGEDVVTTFFYAGVAAHLASIYNEYGLEDPEQIDWEQEAIEAYNWADDLYNPFDACHGFQQYDCKAYAAAALLRLTQNSNYLAGFETAWTDMFSAGFDLLDGYHAYGPNIYARLNNNVNVNTQLQIQNWIEVTGDSILLNSLNRSCRWGGNPWFPMVIGQSTTPLVFEGILAYDLIKNSNPAKASNYLARMHTTADYFLGTGPLNKTWITGIGENPVDVVFHLDAYATGDGETKIGYTPYGPSFNEDLYFVGPYHKMWPNQWTYPDIDSWPGHERWFAQRPAPQATEFTVHQNSNNAAALYGALSNAINCDPDIVSVPNILASTDCLTVFPNPTNSFFTIEGNLPDWEISILNSAGQTIMDLPNNTDRTSINVDLLGKGLFFVKIIDPDDTNVCIQKIIKM